MYQLSRLMRGKARSRAPIMSGIRKFPSVAGIDGHQEEEHHDDPVHGEQLVIGVVLEQAVWAEQIQPHAHGEGSADEEEGGDGEQIQQRDALVVGGEQPRFPAVVDIQVVGAFSGVLRRKRRGHVLMMSSSLLVPPLVALGTGLVLGVGSDRLLM